MTSEPRPEDLHLVLLETSGNQAYLFATNKQREVVGASELLHRIGTTLVQAAIQSLPDCEAYSLGDEWAGAYAPIESGRAFPVEVLLATSGKALILTRGEDVARDLIRAWSYRVLTQAPGADATGVFAGPVDLAAPRDSPGSIAVVLRAAHAQFESARANRISPVARFPWLPVLEACAVSDLPAYARVGTTNVAAKPLARPAVSKWKAARSTELFNRWDALFALPLAVATAPPRAPVYLWHQGGVDAVRDPNNPDPNNPAPYVAATGIDDKALELDWLGVVHADGNGLGQLLLNLAAHADALPSEEEDTTPGRKYIRIYRAFSRELDAASRHAYAVAMNAIFAKEIEAQRSAVAHNQAANGAELQEIRPLPLIPVVVGGDDLTVLIKGEFAIPFAKAFMEAFCAATGDAATCPTIQSVCGVATAALGAPRLGMAAGIAIVKGRFPFHAAYELAEALCRSAKQVKQKASLASIGLDFHIQYDATATSLERARSLLELADRDLTLKPFVVEAAGTAADAAWTEHHAFADFESALKALARNLPSGLPASKAHAFRSDLWREEDAALDGYWKRIQDDKKYEGFAGAWGAPSWSVALPATGGIERRATVFLDALEARRFMPSAEENAHAGHA